MKLTKNLGMLLLGIWLIVTGLIPLQIVPRVIQGISDTAHLLPQRKTLL
jgi:hypothetical protein